jgi:hypothetical protein
MSVILPFSAGQVLVFLKPFQRELGTKYCQRLPLSFSLSDPLLPHMTTEEVDLAVVGAGE